jgi:hypothetical protein
LGSCQLTLAALTGLYDRTINLQMPDDRYKTQLFMRFQVAASPDDALQLFGLGRFSREHHQALLREWRDRAVAALAGILLHN